MNVAKGLLVSMYHTHKQEFYDVIYYCHVTSGFHIQ